jgi:2,3-bisphosphoglycerate-independent phosphoglycerate mutase
MVSLTTLIRPLIEVISTNNIAITNMKSKVALVILDGWGIGSIKESDAIHNASTPFVDGLMEKYPSSHLVTFGEEVGLPEGQMGNSEVGHLNIGAGRIVYQDFTRINKAIKDDTFNSNEELVRLLTKATSEKKTVHLIGLLSDGGVHSHINHVKALIDVCESYDLSSVLIHAFLDGRDTSPDGGKDYVNDLLDYTKDKQATLASIVGRYYAMDRDTRWERTKIAYDLLTKGVSDVVTKDPVSIIKQKYAEGITDEFMVPILVESESANHIAEGDVVICFNFRTDRPRQITEVLTQRDIPEHEMTKLDIEYSGMTKYDDDYNNVGVLFDKDNLKQTLGEVLSANERTQVRIAETEKYPHVTFFFNGGREEPFKGESRIMVPSPKVATYDLQPEMSAEEITTKLIDDIQENAPDFICLNYANTDMVGHTGDFEAAIKAAETVDTCLSQLIPICIENRYDLFIIADHGNSDIMKNPDGSVHTAHTTNPVPCIFVNEQSGLKALSDGKLADLAPTILHLMGIHIPEEMTGSVLVEKVS